MAPSAWIRSEAGELLPDAPDSLPENSGTARLDASDPALAAQDASSGPVAPGPPAAPGPSAAERAHRYAEVIEPQWIAPPLTPGQKFIFSLIENANPITLIPPLYSAGYEQLRNTDPKYGTDARAGASKFGAAVVRSDSVRLFEDGIFAPIFHQDPRYYRVARGSIWHRGLYSARAALVRRNDDGHSQPNYAGFSGRAASAVLTLAYYPPVSRNVSVVLSTFAYSLLTDAGGNLVLEFFPDLVRKFPIIKRFEIE